MRKVVLVLMLCIALSASACSSTPAQQSCSEEILKLHIRLSNKEKAQQCLALTPLTPDKMKNYREIIELL